MSSPDRSTRAADAEPPKRRGRPPAGGKEAILAAALVLLRERGIAKLTTREVASMAGVSEASVYYHYTDRAGLLKAVFEAGVVPLQALGQQGLAGPRRETLMTLGSTLERFFDETLPVLNAAQCDAELREQMSAFMTEQRLGPHRGVEGLGDYFAEEQKAGRMRGDVDPWAAAMLFIGACFLRASQRQMPTHRAELPSLEATVAVLDVLLSP
jgi:AcrR family transcriptional regulator